jgi:flagellar hook-basal body complex protein FliE
MPVDAITAVGPEWQIAMPEATPVDGAGRVGSGSGDGGGFGDMLAGRIDDLSGLQTEAAAQSQALATGQAQDASEVVMAVERAQLSMQLAAQLRDKSIEAFHEIFRTQV